MQLSTATAWFCGTSEGCASGEGRRNAGRLAAGAVAVFCMIAMLAAAAQAATITVDSLSDTSSPGTCTLRDAISTAQGSPVTGSDCTSTADTTNFIVFKSGLTGIITLGHMLPTIMNGTTLTITGPTTSSSGIVFDGTYHYEVMEVDSGATLNLANLTIANGDADDGAGIHNDGTLSVTNSTFSENNGSLGGGITNDGTLSVTNSTFSENVANFGGGIVNAGTLSVTNSTFARNIASPGGGGAINNLGTLTVTNSTFYDNSAGSSGFGGGIFSAAPASFKGTILANEFVGDNCAGDALTDDGYNISDDSSCGFSAIGSHNNLDPELDPAGLSNNGGPTKTIALQSSSPAIDTIPQQECTDQASPPNAITSDQRGMPRPDLGEAFCDIGAYEFQDAFAGTPGRANCGGRSVSALANRYGSLHAAAAVLGYSGVKALRQAIGQFCGG
jgi:fibronectin-binding autotransporter adhesin